MRVVVQFHEQVRDDLDEWLVGRAVEENDRRLLVRVYMQELVRVLRETEGAGPGAVRLTGVYPKTYTWRYTSEVEITYQVRHTGQGFLRPKLLRVVVTECRLVFAE